MSVEEFVKRIKNEPKLKNMKKWHLDQCNSCINRQNNKCLVYDRFLHEPAKQINVITNICKKYSK